MIGDKPITITVSIPEDLPAAQADRFRLSQILLNLLSNAIKFTRQGDIGISAEQDGKFLVIHVTDSGVGIDVQDLDRIFSEFVQLEPDTDPELRGSGLGLPICYRLVQLMGGRMWAESERSRGSVFSFTLPVYKGETP